MPRSFARQEGGEGLKGGEGREAVRRKTFFFSILSREVFFLSEVGADYLCLREKCGLCDPMMNYDRSHQIKQIKHCNSNDKLS